MAAASAVTGWESYNWSGYVVPRLGVTSASSTWKVPAVVASSTAKYSATWVGVDGFTNGDLIQTGTSQDTVGGKTSYYAWWEILPAAETEITTMKVAPGNNMVATVKKISSGRWEIVLADTTTGNTFSKVAGYNGPGSSAEWIEEAPTVGAGQSALADFGTVAFSGVTVNGASVHLLITGSGTMVSATGAVLAKASAPASTGNTFSDTYVVPAAPHVIAPPPPTARRS